MTSIRFSGECVHLLDEAQGLTLEMAEVWLRAHGWTQDGAGLKGWSKPKTWVYGDSVKSLLGEIPEIARMEGLSVQAVLRQMNPRMRTGMPSIAAWESHGRERGFWVAMWGITKDQAGDFAWFAQRPIVTTLRRYGNTWDWGIRGSGFMHDTDEGFPERRWSFWPCDAHGGKIPWPVDEKGVML